MTKHFDRKRLLKQSISKFKNILRWKTRNQIVSMEMQRRIICRNVFGKWSQHTVCVWEERKKRSAQFYNRRCVKVAWSKWQREYAAAQSNKWTAVDWFDLRLTERMFHVWYRVAAERRRLFDIKKMQADAHYNW